MDFFSVDYNLFDDNLTVSHKSYIFKVVCMEVKLIFTCLESSGRHVLWPGTTCRGDIFFTCSLLSVWNHLVFITNKGPVYQEDVSVSFYGTLYLAALSKNDHLWDLKLVVVCRYFFNPSFYSRLEVNESSDFFQGAMKIFYSNPFFIDMDNMFFQDDNFFTEDDFISEVVVFLRVDFMSEVINFSGDDFASGLDDFSGYRFMSVVDFSEDYDSVGDVNAS